MIEIVTFPNFGYEKWYKLFIFDDMEQAIKGIRSEDIPLLNIVSVRINGKSNQQLLSEFREALICQ